MEPFGEGYSAASNRRGPERASSGCVAEQVLTRTLYEFKVFTVHNKIISAKPNVI
jgi:hypothetical protein